SLVAGRLSAAGDPNIPAGHASDTTIFERAWGGATAMTAQDLTALLPFIVVSAACLVVLIATAVRRSHAVAGLVTVAGLTAAFGLLPAAASVAPRAIGASGAGALVVLDGYGLFFIGLILAASVAVAVLAYGYLDRQEEHREEFYILLLVAVLGSMVLAASSHFVSF